MQPYVPMTPPGAPQPTSPRTPWPARLALGCAVGCGAVVVLAMFAGGFGTWWLVRPGPQVVTAGIVAPQADGDFAVGDLGADPGVSALLDHFIREAQRQQQQQTGLPPWVRSLQQAGAASAGSPSTGLRLLLPREATLAVEPGPENQPIFVAAVNPRGLSRLLRELLLRAHESDNETYRGETVMHVDTHAWAAALDGTFVWANDPAALRRAIDRLRAPGAAAPHPPTDLGPPAHAWDLTGTLGNRDGSLPRLLWPDGPPADAGIERARLGVDVATSDRVLGRVVVDCDSAEQAAAAAVALQERAGARAQKLAGSGLTLRASTRVAGSRAALDWQLDGLDAAVSAWLAKSNQPRG